MKRISKFIGLFFLLGFFLSITFTTALAQYYGEEGEGEGEGESQVEIEAEPEIIGGGHVVLNEDLKLGIEKYLSLDGISYYSTPSIGNAFGIPENTKTVVHAKAVVKNTGKVTAINIRLRHDFDQALSDMVMQEFSMAGGPATYNPATGIMKIDEIPVNGSITFFYDMTIDEQGSTSETAADILTLESYESKLPIYHAVMGGPSITDIDHLIAGDPSAVGGVAGTSGSGSASGGSSSTSGMGGGMADDESDIAFILPQTGMGNVYLLLLLALGLGYGFITLIPLRKQRN